MAYAWLTAPLENLIASYGLVTRYMYRNASGSRMLIQAGGHGGVDGMLISVIDNNVFTIEFKEPGAKTSEPDLPKYGEDGMIVLTDAWAGRYPQFVPMMLEQMTPPLNFFERAGTNVHSFSPSSIRAAVSENYAGKKFADVICVEDRAEYLTMLPANQAHLWADTRGEIRPAGRNHYQVFTPRRLQHEIDRLGASVDRGMVKVSAEKLEAVGPRGGTGISRYKITPLFFVRARDVNTTRGIAEFKLADVRQLNPTISAHMFFRGLDVQAVRAHYLGGPQWEG